MKEVTKQEYMDFVYSNPVDLVYSAIGNYPFTGQWKTRGGKLMAKRVDSYPPNAVWPLTSKYYIQQ